MKKGFTLIELLAVIIILAVIAIIATPMIMDVIEKARKGALIESVNGLIDAAQKYRVESMFGSEGYKKTIDLTDNTLTIKGSKPDKGTLFFNEEGQIYVVAKYSKYCIEKKYQEKSPKIVEDTICDNIEEPVSTFIYGVKRLLTTESSAWERINDSVGLEANAQVGTTPVKNDFDNIYPWSGIISYNYDTDTKEITAYYGEDNFTFNPEGNVEVLTKIPEFYYRRYQDNEYEYIYISETPKEGYIKSEEFSVGRYTMSGDATRVHSKSGYNPLTNTTITDFRTYARNLGEEFGQMDYHYFILQLLYLVEYADYNSQAKLGLGYVGSNSEVIISGGCDILGMKSGSVDGTGNSSIIYRGIEDIFGNIWQFVDGINIKDYQTYICYDKNQYMSDKFDGCYQRLGYANASTYKQWISKLGYDASNPLIALPTETSGNSNTHMTDYYWSQAENRIAFAGGNFTDASKAGLYCLSVDYTSSQHSVYAGARLMKTD